MKPWSRNASLERERARVPGHHGSRRRAARGELPLTLLRLAALPLVAGALLASCGALSDDEPALEGETHFLVSCEEECGPGLSCIAGVCTRGCEPGYSSCAELSARAACVSAADGADLAGFAGSCDVLCSSDADCATLSGGHTCREGACRADAAPELGTTGSLQSALVHAVGVDTCKSGLRWTGGNQPSPEMRPGSDCVGCHREQGARPLIVGGTLYNAPGRRGPDPLDDCFGLEGIEVRITDAAGRQFSALTNRAGNFYIEGDESDLAMPYRASLHWTLDGRVLDTPMYVTPLYGGCARCHDLGTREPYMFDGFESIPPSPEYVNPTSVIHAPGLYR